ncbi:unnamed protein product [Effrenium voratum]|nr:unnamed protein product [Effrenium voratum]
MAHPPPGYATVKSEWSECCEDPDAEQGRWQYVGKGRGAFAKVDDIQFVGAGLGEYDVAGPKKSRWLYWFACLGCFLLLLALGLVAIFSHQSRAPGHSEMRYDCYLSGGILPQPGAQLLETWSTPHRIWCCDNLGVACAESTTSSPMPTTWIMVPVPKFEDAMMAPGLVPPIAGAPATAPFVATFHCHVGMPDGWPPAQKEFCCQHVNIGCEAPPAPPVPPEPDCAAGLDLGMASLRSLALACSLLLGCGAPILTLRSEEDFLRALEEGSGADATTLVRHCVSRSWWRAARALVARAHGDGAALAALGPAVRAAALEVKQQAEQLSAFAEEKSGKSETANLAEVHCALQWAQNSTTVFLGVKYAARWSAPGAIEVSDVQVNVSQQHFSLTALGHHSSIRKRYLVELPLFAAVSGPGAWSAASVGRGTATLQKLRPEKWKTLTSVKSKHQITGWLDMEERWSDELKTAEGKSKDGKGKEGKDKAGGKASASKGSVVHTPWQKRLQRQWKKLPKTVRRAAPFVLLTLGSFLAGMSIYSLITARASPAEAADESKVAEAADS